MHALRLMGSGLFDEYPRLQIILGHMGEGLPYSMWRVDNRNAWIEDAARTIRPRRRSANTSATISISPLRQLPHPDADRRDAGGRRRPDAVLDRLAVRERRATRREWFDAAPISEADRVKIGRTNALRLFKLGDR